MIVKSLRCICGGEVGKDRGRLTCQDCGMVAVLRAGGFLFTLDTVRSVRDARKQGTLCWEYLSEKGG